VVVPASAPFGPSEIEATGATSGLTAAAPVNVANQWSESGYDSAHSNSEANDTKILERVGVGPPDSLIQAWSYPAGAAVSTSPAISKDVAYFGDDAGVVTALKVQTSQPVWTATLPSAVRSSPALSSTAVFVGTAGDAVVALLRASGAQLWSRSTSSPVNSSPTTAGSSLFVGSNDGSLYDLNQSTGAVIWQKKLAGAIHGSPSVDLKAGRVIVGDDSGDVTALDAGTGEILWQVHTSGAVDASPGVYNGATYVGSGDGKVYALQEATGAPIWTASTPVAISSTGVLYVPSATTRVPKQYVVGSQDGTISYLSLADGSAVSSASVGGPVVGLSAATGFITATTSNGVIEGLKRAGDVVWIVTATAPFAASAATANGVVYVGGRDETLRAYTSPGVPIP
jgi:outer membrane protein assembly factor BamB